MDLRLAIFITVAEKESFTRAAEIHHMTQPAVSQYIKVLEEEVSTRLLERTNKYVRLNKAGEIVYHHAKEIMGLYTKMQHLVDDLNEVVTGPLAIGASYTFGEYMLPRIIADLCRDYPEIEPRITIGNTALITQLVTTNQLDVGIVEGACQHEKITKELIARDEMVVVGAVDHPLVRTNQRVTREDLARATWIVREQGSGTREVTDRYFKSIQISGVKTFKFSSTQLIKESVAAGVGISLMSKWAIKKELQYKELSIIEVASLPVTRDFSLITKTTFQTKALQKFIQRLKAI